MNLAEGVQFVSFGILAATTIAAALGVVLLENIVYSAFLLGGVFISIAGMYLLLNADFVAAAQVLVYVGAINVLILFAIMLVNKTEVFQPMKNAWFRKGATALVCVGLFALLATMVRSTSWAVLDSVAPIESTAIRLGEHFFSDFLLPFELASVLLLISMIGAIVLARREFVPEETDAQREVVFRLPERPREPVGAIGESSSASENS
ncbi:NADH-quinone oxidoreductase subunit J [Baaleninema simplex]|uniref:NADH-quinone oxidoreductase subunit J n=1 Tax=Baaleninema simplex TaxID=2862350 RepID=UPI000349FCDB|nr:NADH-quinone oxidoreductase subunit J [Baaleninema simplex]